MKHRFGNRVVIVLALCVACVLALGATIAQADVDSGMSGDKSLTVNIEGYDTSDQSIADDKLPLGNTRVKVYLIASGAYLKNYDTYEFTFDVPAFKSLEADYKEVATIKTGQTTNDGGDNQDAQASDEEGPTWLSLATAARDIANDPNSGASPVMADSVAAGTKIDKLQDGLYLVLIEDTVGQTKSYTFTPALVAVPNKVANKDSDTPVANTTVPGVWDVDVVVNAKWTSTPRLGALQINKGLTSFAGEASFVYHVIGTNEKNEVKFEAHREITCTGETNEPVVINNIPVGLKITVTEEYPGANYRAVDGETEKSVDTVVPYGEEEEGNPVSVSFTNEPTNSIKTGHGVENHFVFDDDTNGGDWLIDVHSINDFKVSETMPQLKATVEE